MAFCQFLFISDVFDGFLMKFESFVTNMVHALKICWLYYLSNLKAFRKICFIICICWLSYEMIQLFDNHWWNCNLENLLACWWALRILLSFCQFSFHFVVASAVKTVAWWDLNSRPHSVENLEIQSKLRIWNLGIWLRFSCSLVSCVQNTCLLSSKVADKKDVGKTESDQQSKTFCVNWSKKPQMTDRKSVV